MGLVVKIGSTTLATGIASASVVEGSLVVNGVRAVQLEDLIRAAQPVVFDRATNRNSVQFTVRKNRGTLVAAINATLMARQNTPGVGALTFSIEIDGVTHQWVASRCAWQRTSSGHLGPSGTVGYSVTCGTFEYSSSDSDEWLSDNALGGRDVTTAITDPHTQTRGGRAMIQTAVGIGGRDLAA